MPATIHCTKTPSGALVAANEESADAIRKFKVGAVVVVEARQMRNGPFFRKWWALAKVAFDLWTELCEMPEHKGEKIEPNFERFRKDLTILAGHFHYVANINGDVRAEADSLSWASMDEEKFEQLYSTTIDKILSKVLAGRGVTEEQLREMVDRVMEFA